MEEQIQSPAPTPAPVAKSGGGKKTWLIIVIVIIVLGLGGAFVYTRYFGKPDSILSSVVPKALNSSCKYNDPDLCKFINNWPNVTDMTMTSTYSAEGVAYDSIFRLNGKDKSEMISKSNGKESYHTIEISGTSYYLDYTDNKWWKYTPKASDDTTIKQTKDLVNFDSPEDKSTYKQIGKEACGELTCFKYQVLDPANTDSTEFIFFDDKQYILRKTQSIAKDGTKMESTVSYTSVSIPTPSPTKDGDPFSAVLNGTTTIPTTTPTTSAGLGSSGSSSSIDTSTPADTSTDTTTTDETP